MSVSRYLFVSCSSSDKPRLAPLMHALLQRASNFGSTIPMTRGSAGTLVYIACPRRRVGSEH